MLISEKPGLWARRAALLERLLMRKFGPLPAQIVQRVDRADAAQFETWSLGVLDADTLADVFR